MLEALEGTGKPLVVVLMNGSALAVNWANEHANAILDAWYSGEEGGTAIAETLAGANNPAGRLPVTFYKGTEQLPPFEDYAMKNRTYRYFEGQPLYPFGYGLSYSKFEYSGMKLSNPQLAAGNPLDVEVDIKNTGKRDGDEVAELYITFPKVPGAPLKALRGFTRVPPESRRATAREADTRSARPQLCERGWGPARRSGRLFDHPWWRAAGNCGASCGFSLDDSGGTEAARVNQNQLL